MQKNIKTDEIIVPREARQRSSLTPESVASLAASIAKHGIVLQRILVTEDFTIVAGERRLTAIKLLRSFYEGTPPDLPAHQATELTELAQNPPSWSERWTKIPATVKTNVTPLDSAIYEFIENAHREDISWLDRAKAVYEIHSRCREEYPNHRISDTASVLSYSPALTGRFIDTWADYIRAPQETKTFIEEASSINAASDILRRSKDRSQPKIAIRRFTEPFIKEPEAKESEASDTPATSAPAPKTPLINADFHTWASTYTGQPFNLLHCDFPYGISLDKGEGQSAASDLKARGKYDDSPEIYWSLLETLAEYQDRVIAPSAHILFWFSQNYRRETEDFFISNFPGAIIQPHLMIWHRTDNAGLLPDPRRYGRRTYDTAMLITLGDRLNVKAKALSFAAPWGEKIHRSQKPLPVVEHFLSMFCDKHSSVLDPTCGSGTSLVAAHNLSASRILGIEADESTHRAAVEYYKEQIQ